MRGPCGGHPGQPAPSGRRWCLTQPVRTGSPARRCALLLVAGIALLEIAWVAVLPPFAGSDEVDHAYRAAAVADGQWVTRAVPDEARGLLLHVPEDIVTAAGPDCRSHPASTTETCTGSLVEERPGMRSVASGAASYQPVYYAYVGSIADALTGSTALYAMRLASVLLCLVMLLVAAFAATRSGPWTVFALVATCLPTMTYSMAVTAPNGPEMAAATAWWCGLLAWRPGSRTASMAAVGLGLAGGLLCMLRLLGPVFLVLSLGLVLLARSAQVARIPGELRRAALPVVLVLLGVAAGAGWVLLASSYGGPREAEGGADLGFAHVVLWALQSIGAFPYRDQMAPLATYVLVGTVLVLLVGTALHRARGAPRAALVMAMVLSVAVPLLLTWVTLEDRGNIWQGRYGWPLTMGCLLLAGWVLDERGLTVHPRLVSGAVVALVVGQAISLVGVLDGQRQRDASELVPGWDGPPVLVVGLLCVAAAASLAAATRKSEVHSE